MKNSEIDEILTAGELESLTGNEKKVRSGFWSKIRSSAARLPFAEDVAAAYYCAMDPETPAKVRGILLAALAYFILPLDSIPDFLVGFGFTDDIAVITAALTAIRGHIKDSHREAARRKLNE